MNVYASHHYNMLVTGVGVVGSASWSWFGRPSLRRGSLLGEGDPEIDCLRTESRINPFERTVSRVILDAYKLSPSFLIPTC